MMMVTMLNRAIVSYGFGVTHWGDGGDDGDDGGDDGGDGDDGDDGGDGYADDDGDYGDGKVHHLENQSPFQDLNMRCSHMG